MELKKPVESGIIRVYQKRIKRKLKDGSIKEYRTEQQTVNIGKDSDFVDGENVVVLNKDDYYTLENDWDCCYNAKKELVEVHELYSKSEETNKDLSDEIKRLRNKHDHLQENLRKSLEQINTLQNEINQYANRGFLDYLLGRKIKPPELTEGKED